MQRVLVCFKPQENVGIWRVFGVRLSALRNRRLQVRLLLGVLQKGLGNRALLLSRPPLPAASVPNSVLIPCCDSGGLLSSVPALVVSNPPNLLSCHPRRPHSSTVFGDNSRARRVRHFRHVA